MAACQQHLVTIVVHEKIAGLSIEELLKQYWHAPKKLVHQLRMEKAVTINKESQNWKQVLNVGDVLHIQLCEDSQHPILASNSLIEVLYEDDHLLIVNKRAQMDTHPNEPGQTGTLANVVAAYFQRTNQQNLVKYVHRLDKDTTGAILFAKHSLSHAILNRMLEEKQITRIYYALATGKMKQKLGKIKEPIGRDRHHPTKRRVSKTGQSAVTSYRVLKQYPKQNLTLVQCTLETGRTHQIRVHLSYIGHPIAGDVLYGGQKLFNRQALHARQLILEHPFTGDMIDCTAPYLDEPAIFSEA